MPDLHPIDSSPFGMGIYPSFRTSGDETIRAARMARDAGIIWTRDEIGWAALQPERDVWRWERFDRAIGIMAEQGVQTLGLLCYSAPWAAAGGAAAGSASAPEIGAWREYVGRTVERYRDRVHAWELWNEPNNRGFLGR